MLKDVAPLGFDPQRYSKKPQKGNILMEFVEELPQLAPSSRPSTTHGGGRGEPSWRQQTECKSRDSLEVVTNTYYAAKVKPLINRFLQRCFVVLSLIHI